MRARHERIDVGGESFCYVARGAPTAPLVLCLHGFPDAPDSFLPLLGDLAAAGYRAVAPWIRGYAPSTTEPPHGPRALGLDALRLSAALSPGSRPLLVGHDWGAIAVYVAAGLAPERVAAAVTMAVPHPIALAKALFKHPAQLLRSAYALAFQVPHLPERAIARRADSLTDLFWRAWSPGLVPPAELAKAVSACLEASIPAPLEHYRALRRQGELRALFRDTSPIRVPTLQIHGARDRCIAASLGDAQARYFEGPFAREIVAGAGHFVHVEAPEATSRAAIGWLAAYGQQ